jgi:hypothetical protein
MGYHVSWIAPPGKDRGIDVLAWTDPVGTKPPRIKVQEKRRNSESGYRERSNARVGGVRTSLPAPGRSRSAVNVASGKAGEFWRLVVADR